jgi:4,5-DOPA dioxygenase extradiol
MDTNTHALMPVLFIGHGNPMNALLENDFTESLKALGKRLPKPEAIMVISAHWLTDGTYMGCMEKPETIHDFYGFPGELYAATYPAPGAPAAARSITEIVKRADVRCSMKWGLDHGSWTILRHMYPEASIPVFEMSLDYSFNDWHPKPILYHYELAKELFELRKRGILIIGSGNIVHNLGMIDFANMDAQPFGWAEEFDEKVKANPRSP